LETEYRTELKRALLQLLQHRVVIVSHC